MKRLTSNEEKLKIVAKLVKEGTIDFAEAIKLLEVEVEKEIQYIPYPQGPLEPLRHLVPYTQPLSPYTPNPFNSPYIITCDTKGGNFEFAN